MLEEFADERVRVDFVWTPAFGIPSLPSPTSALGQSSDPRSRAWYDDGAAMGKALKPFTGTDFDMYLIYKAGAQWPEGDDAPGEPDYMLNGHEGSGFDAASFRGEIETRLPTCDEVVSG